MNRRIVLALFAMAPALFPAQSVRAEVPTTQPRSPNKLDQIFAEIDQITADVDKTNSQKADPLKLAPFVLKYRPYIGASPRVDKSSNIEDWRSSSFNGHNITVRPALYHETYNAVRDLSTGKVILHRDFANTIKVDPNTLAPLNDKVGTYVRPTPTDLLLLDDRPKQK